VERLLETVTTDGHQFRAQRKTNIDAAGCDLVCNILCSFETGGTESVDCRGGSCVWEASCKGSSTEFVCGFAIGDLRIGMLDAEVTGSGDGSKGHTLPQQISSTSWGSSFDFSMTFFINAYKR
jgi:hypothetical protein